MDQPRLTIDLIPKACWWSNLGTYLSAPQWIMARKKVVEAAGCKCQVCGGVGTRIPVVCHEVWEYDDEKHVQRLVGLIALCPHCHQSKHFGLATINKKAGQVKQRLAIVNGWSKEQVNEHINHSLAVWKARNAYSWTLDLSWFKEAFGVEARTKKLC